MRPTWTIADIFETPGRAKVLRTLVQATGPLSVRGTAARAGISHTATGEILRDLESMGLASRRFVGRAHVFMLERENIYVRDMVAPAVDAEETVLQELCGDLTDRFSVHAESLILFGSYASGEQAESSDIDLFALATDSLCKQRLAETARMQGAWFKAKYGSPLSLMVYTRTEAAIHMLGGKSVFGTELAGTGIILHGLAVDEWGIDGEIEADTGGGAGGRPTVSA